MLKTSWPHRYTRHNQALVERTASLERLFRVLNQYSFKTAPAGPESDDAHGTKNIDKSGPSTTLQCITSEIELYERIVKAEAADHFEGQYDIDVDLTDKENGYDTDIH